MNKYLKQLMSELKTNKVFNEMYIYKISNTKIEDNISTYKIKLINDIDDRLNLVVDIKCIWDNANCYFQFYQPLCNEYWDEIKPNELIKYFWFFVFLNMINNN